MKFLFLVNRMCYYTKVHDDDDSILLVCIGKSVVGLLEYVFSVVTYRSNSRGWERMGRAKQMTWRLKMRVYWVSNVISSSTTFHVASPPPFLVRSSLLENSFPVLFFLLLLSFSPVRSFLHSGGTFAILHRYNVQTFILIIHCVHVKGI